MSAAANLEEAVKSKNWEAIAEAKKAALFEQIPAEFIIPKDIFPPEEQLDVTEWPKTSGWFTDEELEITGTPATALLRRLVGEKWSAETVARAFCKKAAAAHQLTNCLTDTLFDDAIATAKKLDEHLRKTGKPVGPLHGLPVSLKDNFNIKGHDSSVGFASLVGQPATYNTLMVDILRDAGAVFYCKTNIPTAMMIAESVNNVFGRTTNPKRRTLTSGGSSGGESALIKFGASPLGVGTDIGGSVRIPAAMTGIYTLRPSFPRFPTLRSRPGLAGQEAVQSVNGPMSADFGALELFAKAVVDSEPWYQDPRMLPIPWRSVEKKNKLKIGVLWNDGIVTPTPPVTRALKEIAEKLKAKGHEIIDWANNGHAELVGMLGKLFTADGGKTVKKLLEPTGEPWRPEMKHYETAQELGVHEMWQIQIERTGHQKDYLDRWNACKGLDALLCPCAPYAAVEHGGFKYVGYTAVFNVLDYSCVTLPCGVNVDKAVDVYPEDFKPQSDQDAECHKSYNSDAIDGMPVSLQLVARRLEEEKVLKMAETVLEAF